MLKPAFQEIISALQSFWKDQGHSLMMPMDMQVGAGTSHPLTFFGALSSRPCKIAYVQPSRRPADGRLGQNGLRLQHYFQFQVLSKPAPSDGLQAFVASIEQACQFQMEHWELQCLEDNWANPSLGAKGVGWEIRLNGLEVAQITYFQQMGGCSCQPSSLEITYGLERLAMLAQGVQTAFEIRWSPASPMTYGDWFEQAEWEQGWYNFNAAPVESLKRAFDEAQASAEQLLLQSSQPMLRPAYEHGLQMGHLFNLLEARRALGVLERQRALLKIRQLNHQIANCYLEQQRHA